MSDKVKRILYRYDMEKPGEMYYAQSLLNQQGYGSLEDFYQTALKWKPKPLKDFYFWTKWGGTKADLIEKRHFDADPDFYLTAETEKRGKVYHVMADDKVDAVRRLHKAKHIQSTHRKFYGGGYSTDEIPYRSRTKEKGYRSVRVDHDQSAQHSATMKVTPKALKEPRKEEAKVLDITIQRGGVENVENIAAEIEKNKRAMRVYLENNGIEVNDDDTVTLYHGTSKAGAAEIISEGFIKGTTGKRGAGVNVDKAAWLTPDKDYTKIWGGEVVEVKVPTTFLRHLPQNTKEFYFNKGLRRQDGIWLPLGTQKSGDWILKVARADLEAQEGEALGFAERVPPLTITYGGSHRQEGRHIQALDRRFGNLFRQGFPIAYRSKRKSTLIPDTPENRAWVEQQKGISLAKEQVKPQPGWREDVKTMPYHPPPADLPEGQMMLFGSGAIGMGGIFHVSH